MMIKCKYFTRLIKKIKSLDNDHMIDLLMIYRAIGWAQKYHAGQFRKTGEVFYSHPLEVAYKVSDYLLKTDVIVTSILHDIVEDTEVTVEMISNAFTPRIAQMVDRLTRDRPDGSKLTVRDILHNAYKHQDDEVLLVKCFDRLHNMETIHVYSATKIQRITSNTLRDFLTSLIYLGLFKEEQKMLQLCLLPDDCDNDINHNNNYYFTFNDNASLLSLI